MEINKYLVCLRERGVCGRENSWDKSNNNNLHTKKSHSHMIYDSDGKEIVSTFTHTILAHSAQHT